MNHDWYVEGFGLAIGDARAKLLDEGWFSRRTPEPVPSKDLGWMREEQTQPEHSSEPNRDNDHDVGIDR
jgi:hypothetical protein